MRFTFFSIPALICLSALCIQAEKVFIAPPVTSRVSANEWNQMYSAFKEAYTKKGDAVIDINEGKAILEKAGVETMVNCENAVCARQWGQKLRADRVVVGSVKKNGEQFSLSFTSVSVVATEEQPLQVSREFAGSFASIMEKGVPEVAFLLTGQTLDPVTKKEDKLTVREVTVNRRAERRNLFLGAGVTAVILTAGYLIYSQEKAEKPTGPQAPTTADVTFDW